MLLPLLLTPSSFLPRFSCRTFPSTSTAGRCGHRPKKTKVTTTIRMPTTDRHLKMRTILGPHEARKREPKTNEYFCLKWSRAVPSPLNQMMREWIRMWIASNFAERLPNAYSVLSGKEKQMNHFYDPPKSPLGRNSHFADLQIWIPTPQSMAPNQMFANPRIHHSFDLEEYEVQERTTLTRAVSCNWHES